VLDTVAADKIYRGQAVIEQVHADLKNSALAHLPSGKFAANAAWLVLAVIAFNLTRAAAVITGPALARSTTSTIRTKADRRARAHRVLDTADHFGPAERLTMGNPLDPALHPRVRATDSGDHLTIQPAARPPNRRGTPCRRGQALTHALVHSSMSSPTRSSFRLPLGGSRLRLRPRP
jgi:hypothetical protein